MNGTKRTSARRSSAIKLTISLIASAVVGALVAPTAAMGDPVAPTNDQLVLGGSVFQGPFQIVNAHTGRCLDAHLNGGGANNSPVGLWDCNGGDTEHWWVWYNEDRVDYKYYVSNVRWNMKCLDYPWSSGGAIGWQFNIYDCEYSTTQHFRISGFNQQVGGRLLTVKIGGPNNHMDAFASDGGGNGNRVGNWAWTGHRLQHWRFVKVPEDRRTAPVPAIRSVDQICPTGTRLTTTASGA